MMGGLADKSLAPACKIEEKRQTRPAVGQGESRWKICRRFSLHGHAFCAAGDEKGCGLPTAFRGENKGSLSRVISARSVLRLT